MRLFRREAEGMVAAGAGTTDADGRIARLLEGELLAGWYQLVFDLSTYYGSQQHFFGRVALDIAVSQVRQHHVPLLVSPHSCTVYRGS